VASLLISMVSDSYSVMFTGGDGATSVWRADSVPKMPYSLARRIQWYMEDFPRYPFEPNDSIAHSIERDFDYYGIALHERILKEASTGVKEQLLGALQSRQLHIQIDHAAQSNDILWESLLWPGLGHVFANARTFCFVDGSVDFPAFSLRRLLIVIARPSGAADVRYRSVAGSLIEGLRGTDVTAEVLRPSTFERLAERLYEATESCQPFDVVHFDGHGVIADLSSRFGAGVKEGRQGYLAFEAGGGLNRAVYVDGTDFGKVVASAGTPLVTLNACRSAMDPGSSDQGESSSFSLSCLRAGVKAIVSMRYNVLVNTAADFTEALFANLAAGNDVSHSFTRASQKLAAPVGSRRDWIVPVLVRGSVASLNIAGNIVKKRARGSGTVINRDETILAIDRAFDDHAVVQLRGRIGVGASGVADAYVRWLRATAPRRTIAVVDGGTMKTDKADVSLIVGGSYDIPANWGVVQVAGVDVPSAVRLLRPIFAADEVLPLVEFAQGNLLLLNVMCNDGRRGGDAPSVLARLKDGSLELRTGRGHKESIDERLAPLRELDRMGLIGHFLFPFRSVVGVADLALMFEESAREEASKLFTTGLAALANYGLLSETVVPGTYAFDGILSWWLARNIPFRDESQFCGAWCSRMANYYAKEVVENAKAGDWAAKQLSSLYEREMFSALDYAIQHELLVFAGRLLYGLNRLVALDGRRGGEILRFAKECLALGSASDQEADKPTAALRLTAMDVIAGSTSHARNSPDYAARYTALLGRFRND